jgi:hypothetical protein
LMGRTKTVATGKRLGDFDMSGLSVFGADGIEGRW